MIVTKSEVIVRNVADAASRSLDSAVTQKKAEGILNPEKSTLETLQWTPETTHATKDFEKLSDKWLNDVTFS